MKQLESILTSYGIFPIKIEMVTEKLFRIRDQHHDYALKKSSLSLNTVNKWANTYHQANALNLTMILPVYLTSQGNLYQQDNGSIFYLMPWLEGNSGDHSIKQFYQNIGQIHAKTKGSQAISSESMIPQFKVYKDACVDAHKLLLSCMEMFEQNQYMSPFELLVCTQYRDLETVYHHIQKRIEQFTEALNEHPSWNSSLCHGKLNQQHIIQSTQNYIINWENAYYDNAIHDLAIYYTNLVIYYDAPFSSLIDDFNLYMEENRLDHKELYLLIIYLLDQRKYLTLVQDYKNKTTVNHMIEQIKTLQQTYRQLMFGLKFSHFVDEEFDSISLDELES